METRKAKITWLMRLKEFCEKHHMDLTISAPADGPCRVIPYELPVCEQFDDQVMALPGSDDLEEACRQALECWEKVPDPNAALYDPQRGLGAWGHKPRPTCPHFYPDA